MRTWLKTKSMYITPKVWQKGICLHKVEQEEQRRDLSQYKTFRNSSGAQFQLRTIVIKFWYCVNWFKSASWLRSGLDQNTIIICDHFEAKLAYQKTIIKVIISPNGLGITCSRQQLNKSYYNKSLRDQSYDYGSFVNTIVFRIWAPI